MDNTESKLNARNKSQIKKELKINTKKNKPDESNMVEVKMTKKTRANTSNKRNTAH